jgi:hypothetical protein
LKSELSVALLACLVLPATEQAEYPLFLPPVMRSH